MNVESFPMWNRSMLTLYVRLLSTLVRGYSRLTVENDVALSRVTFPKKQYTFVQFCAAQSSSRAIRPPTNAKRCWKPPIYCFDDVVFPCLA